MIDGVSAGRKAHGDSTAVSETATRRSQQGTHYPHGRNPSLRAPVGRCAGDSLVSCVLPTTISAAFEVPRPGRFTPSALVALSCQRFRPRQIDLTPADFRASASRPTPSLNSSRRAL